MNNELTHWGIKGMKWGVRRSEAQLARIRGKATKDDWSDDARVASEIRTKKVKQMSNAELRKLNERMQLEQTYSQLTKKDTSAGKKFVQDIMRDIAKETVKNVVKSQVNKGQSLIGDKLKEQTNFKLKMDKLV